MTVTETQIRQIITYLEKQKDVAKKEYSKVIIPAMKKNRLRKRLLHVHYDELVLIRDKLRTGKDLTDADAAMVKTIKKTYVAKRNPENQE